MYSTGSYGPTFGAGHDVYVNVNMNHVNCRYTQYSYRGGISYSYAANEMCGSTSTNIQVGMCNRLS